MTRRLAATTGMLLAASALSLSFTEIASARGAYRIVNQNSGMALMPAGGSTAWGTPIFQRPVSRYHHAQQWFLQDEGDGRISFRNRASNFCIHPSEWSATATGAYLNQARCDTSNGARMWERTYDWTRGTYTIRARKNGLYMDIEDSSSLTSALAVQARSDGTPSQKWTFQYVGSF